MLDIENDDYLYLQTLIEKPFSYVLNVRKASTITDVSIHRGWCKTLRTKKRTDRFSPFTGQGYKKVIFSELQEVEEWLADHSLKVKSIRECSNCNPLSDINPQELPDESILFDYQTSQDSIADELTDEQLYEKLALIDEKAKKVLHSSYRYERSPYVRVLVLRRANGICERCNKPAPFLSKNNKPFLEVHHSQFLSQGGDDVVSNCEALCPNCHRKIHFGAK